MPYDGIFTVDHVLTPDETQFFIDYIDHAPDDAPHFSMADFKNGKMRHTAWATLFWDRLRQRAPALFGSSAAAAGPPTYVAADGTSWELVGACDHVMYALVHPGQSFPIHTDTGCVWEEGGDVRSKFTVLVYLNEGFRGGRTLFYDEGFRQTTAVEPKAGRALVFDIDLFHAGETVAQDDGNAARKYWIGTEIVARRRAPPPPIENLAQE